VPVSSTFASIAFVGHALRLRWRVPAAVYMTWRQCSSRAVRIQGERKSTKRTSVWSCAQSDMLCIPRSHSTSRKVKNLCRLLPSLLPPTRLLRRPRSKPCPHVEPAVQSVDAALVVRKRSNATSRNPYVAVVNGSDSSAPTAKFALSKTIPPKS
jgi:hypothetical protein